MKVKKLFLFAAAAAMFAACSDDGLTKQTAQQTPQDNGAVTFDAYMQRNTTRAGYVGEATTTELKNIATEGALGKSGFGVFAYYTDNFDYTPLYQPNFMYNEQVKWDGTAFKYDVTKYWPNEHGSQAQSSDMDRVSFFAYLPYVEVEASTGMLASSGTPLDASDEKLQWGITGMKRNTLQGDPVIQYISSFDQSKSVDLCWGTTGGTDITWSTNGSTQTIKAGYPWLNVRKPSGVVSDDARVKFNFQHALAKLAVTVKTDFTDSWTSTTTATQTRVWVRSIRFTGIAHKAALNLNNPKTLTGNKARWIDYYGTNELELGESVTVYDGRKDGSEGVADALAPNEAVLGLNPAIVQIDNLINSTPAWKTDDGLPSGVTPTPVNVFRNGTTAAASHVYVIPTGEKVNVEIVYDIETIDPKLPTTLSDGETPGSTIENRITKAVTFGTSNKLENGKSYTLNLILGMKDVQFTATVNESWEDGGKSDTYLPNNLPTVTANTTTQSFTVPYDAILHPDITITGLTSGTDYSVTAIESPVTAPTAASIGEADASGNLTITGIALAPNTTVANVTTGKITVRETSSATTTTIINFKQLAKPFVFAENSLIGSGANDRSFQIEAKSSQSGTVTEDQYADAFVKVEKQANGSTAWTTLSKNSSADSDASHYTRTNGTLITIGDLDGLANDDKIRITIQVGDTDPVSKVITVTGVTP